MSDRPSFVLIMTDTQCKSMIGAYNGPVWDTPNLDALAASGLRFERAYTSCPLCTPARAGLFSGMQPGSAGAWANEMSPQRHIPLMGDLFRAAGYRAAYTGKWHLDGGGYHGNGRPGGGFEPDWWYDGARYLADIGPDRYQQLRKTPRDAASLEAVGATVEEMWAHRVASRAIDFLDRVGEDPFVLVVSFDEPHGPFLIPPEFAGRVDADALPERPNYNAPLDGKPETHKQMAAQHPVGATWRDYAHERQAHWDCNAYVDREIGRVIDAVRATHGEDTYILYTADHGDQIGSHGLRSKGAMMYEESVNIPLIVSGPGVAADCATDSLASHLDVLPTMAALAGLDSCDHFHGQDLAPIFADPAAAVQRHVLVQYHRFGWYHNGVGDMHLTRTLVADNAKLTVTLDDRDELYDLQADPWEMTNAIDAGASAELRDELHERMLAEMDRIADPFRGLVWRNRPWRATQETRPFFGLGTDPIPAGLQ